VPLHRPPIAFTLRSKPDVFRIGIELGADGGRAVWNLDFPGCCTVVPAGIEPLERMRLATLEFLGWSHNRSAHRLTLEPGALTVVEQLSTAANVLDGESYASFAVEDQEPAPREFAQWAHLHDQALDELTKLLVDLPQELSETAICGRAPREAGEAAARREAMLGELLSGLRYNGHPGDLRQQLADSHRWLQQTVCAVPAATVARNGQESWSVRKVMRRSVWHLRYAVAELHAQLSVLWLG
jgi:hypothetical protein